MKPPSLKTLILFFTLIIVLSSCAVEEIPKYTLSTTVSPTEGGKIIVSPQSPDYKEGDVVTLTAEPNEHWVFKQWEGDGSGSSTPLQITISSNKSVVGVFVKRDYPLTLTIEGEGTVEEKIVTNPGGKVYPHGTTVELTPKPNNGWVFSSWGGDLTGSETPKRIIIDKERKVTVKFIRNPIVTTLNCNAATNNGTLTSGVAVTGVVNIVIPYSGAFGGIHNGQTVTSTGVTGLTATLAAGTFAIGSGNLTYSITGTPSAEGIASFAINIGGQTCIISRTVVSFSPQYPAGSIFCANGPTEIVDVINPITGKTWMDRNLGAKRAATSSTDAESYGDLYQWGRRSDGHQCRNSDVTTSSSSIDQPISNKFFKQSTAPYDWRSPQNVNLWQGTNGINNPCPNGYRLPSENEFRSELASLKSALDSPLKLTLAGFRNVGSGEIFGDLINGYFWTSTVSTSKSRFLSFTTPSNTSEIFWGIGSDGAYRAVGMTVRCIKN